MSAPSSPPARLPASDVSPWVGLVGLATLLGWIAFARLWPTLVTAFDLPAPAEPLSGPNSALLAMVLTGLAMATWSVLVDKVHRRPSTGIDWTRPRPLSAVVEVSVTKLAGLWATWLIIGAFYALGRWYWGGDYLFAMRVIVMAALPLFVLSIPYVLWLDRYLVEPRDHAWHFGTVLFELLFVIDVQIGTVGYLLTLRPLDAHIRSGNPFLAGWLAALICYPPFVYAFMGQGGVIQYEYQTADWGYWIDGHPVVLWAWAGWLAFLTAAYAWATIAFGIRFSNLTYRGVLTNGPYRFTRHPAYLAKNLFWWCSAMPFLVTTGSPTEAIRNTVFLACVSGIYYWRARTEEAHLLSEDAKYRAYHAWMADHGTITAPLRRFLTWASPRKLQVQPAE